MCGITREVIFLKKESISFYIGRYRPSKEFYALANPVPHPLLHILYS
jgi:hypothetical protein